MILTVCGGSLRRVVDIGSEGQLFFGAGDFESMVQLTCDEIKAVAGTTVIDVTNPVDTPEPPSTLPSTSERAVVGTASDVLSGVDWSLDRKPKFIVDVMLGRLAKWLRLVGYDTLAVTSTDSRCAVPMLLLVAVFC
jgi:hypothetical protein